MKNKKQLFENIVHGIFLILGLIAVACVLMITIYLVISGIPAIREIGLVPFLFGTTWASTAAEPSYGILPFILPSVYGTAGAIVIGVPIGILTADSDDVTYCALDEATKAAAVEVVCPSPAIMPNVTPAHKTVTPASISTA